MVWYGSMQCPIKMLANNIEPTRDFVCELQLVVGLLGFQNDSGFWNGCAK
jgi:hypothetical protein